MSEIPLIYKDKCLIRRKVYHISDSSTFFVTKKLEFIEINKNQEIVNYIKLQNSDETFNDVDIPDKIQLKTYERLDSSLILLFQLSDKVFVIKRKRFEIKLIKVFHEVDSFKIKGQIKNNENVVVLKMKDGSSEQTSFNDEEFDKETRENNVELIKSIDSNIKYQKTCMIKTLKNITLKQQLKIYLMIGKQKFLPRFMRLHDPNDVSPLVRFGCIFSRVCNDKLVIGIPVFNASSLESPQPYPVEVLKHVPVDRPYPVPTPVHVPVEVIKHVPFEVVRNVDRPVPYPVEVIKQVQVDRPVPVPTPVHVPYEVVRHVPVDRPVPYPVATPVRMLLENLKLITFCPTLSNGAFRYDLFKMKTDCPSFEEFEKLFNEQFENEAGDVSVPEKPEHKVEWSRCCEKSLLYACEAGVFVVVADIIQFVNDMNHKITFNVSYEIEGNLMNSKLITNIGQFVIDSKLIYSSQLDINQYSLEKYRNLLAITSTSEMIAAFDISFEENERIENFFVKELNFEIIKSHEDIGVEQPSSYFENVNTKTVSLRLRQDYFLYAFDGYFKGTLIRIRLESDELMKAKIYARAAHQVIILLQSIYKQYPRHCKIKLKKVF